MVGNRCTLPLLMDTVTRLTAQGIPGTSLIMQGLRGSLSPCKTPMVLQWEHITQTESINIHNNVKLIFNLHLRMMIVFVLLFFLYNFERWCHSDVIVASHILPSILFNLLVLGVLLLFITYLYLCIFKSVVFMAENSYTLYIVILCVKNTGFLFRYKSEIFRPILGVVFSFIYGL